MQRFIEIILRFIEMPVVRKHSKGRVVPLLYDIRGIYNNSSFRWNPIERNDYRTIELNSPRKSIRSSIAFHANYNLSNCGGCIRDGIEYPTSGFHRTSNGTSNQYSNLSGIISNVLWVLPEMKTMVPSRLEDRQIKVPSSILQVGSNLLRRDFPETSAFRNFWLDEACS